MGVAVSDDRNPVSVATADRLAGRGDKLVGQAELEARKLQEGGSAFLAKVGSRLDLRAHIAELPEPLAPGKLTDPVLNAAGRAEALHALADAFDHAARRLKSIV